MCRPWAFAEMLSRRGAAAATLRQTRKAGAVKPRLTRIAWALLPLLHIGHAQTATVTWVGPRTGSWAEASNWNPKRRIPLVGIVNATWH